MVIGARFRFNTPCFILAFFLAIVCLLVPASVMALEKPVETTKVFPGLNEVVPQATSVAAKVTEAHDQIQRAEAQGFIYETLDALNERLKELEERYQDWKYINSWQFNSLRNAQSSYADLANLQKVQLKILYTHLQNLETLRSTWEEEKTYWHEWQGALSKTHVKVPEETFERTHTSIDNLLNRITKVAGELVKAQQKYSPGQEIIASRLSIIDKTVDSLRKDTFRRNTFSIFESGYYHQFNREMFANFTNNLTTNIRLPIGYFKQVLGLQLVCIFIITLLFIYRRKQSRPIAKEWSFLFRRPLEGATFISIIVIGNFTYLYRNIPPGWRWLLIIIMAVVTIRLIKVINPQPLEKKIFSTIAFIFIITESLQYFGLPTPLLQLYHGLLCAVTIHLCWRFIRDRPKEMSRLFFMMYLLLSIAIVSLTTTMLGFERFATSLIAATLGTVTFFIILKVTLRLVYIGVDAFMQLEWIRNRHFMQVLGLKEGTRKLQALLKIIILLNAGLILLVIWMVFDNVAEARETLSSYEYKFGEFAFSVKMVVMVIIVLYLTTIISWMIQAFVDSQIMTPRKMERGIKESLKRLVHYGLFTVGFLMAISMAGLDLQKFTILAGAFGVGIGFGLQNIVNNFVSGLILLFERPVKVGDIINIDQDWGTITRIGLRSTVFETFDRSEIIVPNADLIAQKVTNWTFSSKIVRVVLPVGVAYGSPLEKVLEILNKAAAEHSEVIPYPKPDSIFEGFGTSSIDFKLRFWVNSIDERLRIRTEVAVIIDRLFREEDIVIAFPQQDLHLRSIDSDLQDLFRKNSSKTKTD
jgi:small-conductance mechanosensitive channel